jgi:branched-chain amino acid transport system ATP-binding protein
MAEPSGGDPVLRVERLFKRFGGVNATDDLSLDLRRGEIHALIGPNGAGKTTFIGQLMGEIEPDSGRILFEGRDIAALSTPARVRAGLARTFQITQLLGEETALGNVALAVQARQGHSFRFWARAGADESLRGPACDHLAAAGLAARAQVRVHEMSHGEHKQLELAVALASQPRVLLLDEPMAGLGASESRDMVEALKRMKGGLSILLVEHDMNAVFALADRVSVLVYGRIIASGTPAEIQADAQVRAAYLGEGDA